MAWSSDPATLDPARVVDVVGGEAVSLLFEGLVALDADGRLVPALAKSWQIEDSGQRYRFELDESARAADGTPVTAEQVVASWRRVLQPSTASPRTWVLDRIRGAAEFRAGTSDSLAGLRILADGRLEVELVRPSASFLSLLTMPTAAVLPSSLSADGTNSTGPWRLAERVRDQFLRFERNPHWHGKQPAFDEIQISILPEEFARIAEFEVGRLDVLEVPVTEAARFRADSRWADHIHRQVALVTEYIGLNVEDPILSDPRVRRALNYAVNVDLVLETILEGRGVRASGAVPPSLAGGGQGEAWPYDPQEAKRLLAEAEVADDWILELWQRPSPRGSRILEAVQSDLRRVGITAKIRVRDWGALKSAIDDGETAAFFINWYADYPDPENFLTPLFHTQNIGGGGNRARYSNVDVDRLLDRLERTAAVGARAELVAEIDRLVQSSAPWIPLWHPIREIVVSERVSGYRPHVVPAAERWLQVAPAAASAP